MIASIRSGKKAGEFTKQAVDHRHRAARLVAVEERFERLDPEALGLGLRDLSLQTQHFLEQRPHRSKIVCRAGLAPYRFAFGGNARDSLDKIAGHRNGMAMTPPHLAEIGLLPRAKSRVCALGRVKKIIDFSSGQLLVCQQAQCRQLFGAGSGAARRHHRGAVPIQHPDRLLERAHPAKSTFQFLIGGH